MGTMASSKFIKTGSMAACSGRRLSYVYYFHRQPRPFRGGDLLLYDTDRQAGNFEMGVFTRIEPLHNSIVFFSQRLLPRDHAGERR